MSWPQADVDAHYKRLRQPTPDLTKDEAPPSPALAPKPRKPRRKLEEQVQRQIVDLLEAHGWLVMRTNKFCGQAVATQGAIEPGMPDIQARKGPVIEIRGQCGSRMLVDWKTRPLFELFWIEVKRPGGKVSTVQATWHQLARARGETVLVAESVEEVAAAIGVKL